MNHNIIVEKNHLSYNLNEVKIMYDVIIVGAGPIGLYGATLGSLHNLNGLIIEASSTIGGQLTSLYPEKDIIDLPGFNKIKAKNFIKNLSEQYESKKNHFPLKLEEKVCDLKKENDYYLVITDKEQYQTKTIVLTTGMGTFSPRPIGLDNENELKNILYSCKDVEIFKNKDVVILGGGDSAVDLSLLIKPLSKTTTIIHRREDFRAQSSSVDEMYNQKINVLKNKSIISVNHTDDQSLQIKIKDNNTQNEETITTDYILVQYGQIPSKDNFPVEKENNLIKVYDYYQTSLENIFACGNIITYSGKVKNLTTGFGEISTVITKIDQIINPTKNIPIHF